MAVHFGPFDFFHSQFEDQMDKISPAKDSFWSNLDPDSAQTLLLNVLNFFSWWICCGINIVKDVVPHRDILKCTALAFGEFKPNFTLVTAQVPEKAKY